MGNMTKCIGQIDKKWEKVEKNRLKEIKTQKGGDVDDLREMNQLNSARKIAQKQNKR